MTVVERDSDGRYLCRWFDDKNQPDQQYFGEAELKRVG